MRRILKGIILCIGIFLLTGCGESKSFNYQFSTGDNVKVSLDTSGGYDLVEGNPFKILLDKKEVASGSFISSISYDAYLKIANSSTNIKLEKNSKKGDMEYSLFFNGTKYNFAIKIKDSKTGILLGNFDTKSDAMDCLKKLNLKLVK